MWCKIMYPPQIRNQKYFRIMLIVFKSPLIGLVNILATIIIILQDLDLIPIIMLCLQTSQTWVMQMRHGQHMQTASGGSSPCARPKQCRIPADHLPGRVRHNNSSKLPCSIPCPLSTRWPLVLNDYLQIAVMHTDLSNPPLRPPRPLQNF